jgi:hypothetical protein
MFSRDGDWTEGDLRDLKAGTEEGMEFDGEGLGAALLR